MFSNPAKILPKNHHWLILGRSQSEAHHTFFAALELFCYFFTTIQTIFSQIKKKKLQTAWKFTGFDNHFSIVLMQKNLVGQIPFPGRGKFA